MSSFQPYPKKYAKIYSYAPVAQLDRVLGFEPSGCRFKSCRVYQEIIMNQPLTNTPLSTLTTMRLGGPARHVVEVHAAEQVPELLARLEAQHEPHFILGGGSNTIAHDEGFPGTILLVKIPGFEILDDSADHTTIRVGAGELWDSVVARTVDMGLSGIECLSAIPGTAGAAPVQNIGAYGQELSQTMVSLYAYDLARRQFTELTAPSCQFDYRSSIFRTSQTGRYFICYITLQLSKSAPQPPYYQAVQAELTARGIARPTPMDLRQIVSQIRAHKLPDPAKLPNSGSFFKNAIISTYQFQQLQSEYPSIPHYPAGSDSVKVPTGWLIEQTGLKGQTIDGIHIHDHNALVLINRSATSYQQLAHARDQVTSAVRDRFGITIYPEPLEIPTR